MTGRTVAEKTENLQQMAKMALVVTNMRYWCTLDSVFKRIVRFSGDLSTAMRAFSYSFALALVFKNSSEIRIGQYLLDQHGVEKLSIPVGTFIVFDLLHPLLALVALHIIQGVRFLNLKRYEGKEMELYDEKLDRTELIYEMHPFESFGTSVLPNFLLLIKIAIVGWTIIEIICRFNKI